MSVRNTVLAALAICFLGAGQASASTWMVDTNPGVKTGSLVAIITTDQLNRLRAQGLSATGFTRTPNILIGQSGRVYRMAVEYGHGNEGSREFHAVRLEPVTNPAGRQLRMNPGGAATWVPVAATTTHHHIPAGGSVIPNLTEPGVYGAAAVRTHPVSAGGSGHPKVTTPIVDKAKPAANPPSGSLKGWTVTTGGPVSSMALPKR